MKKIALTIITVVKNNLVGLKETFDYLQKQTDQNYFWLVFDGLSTDGTKEWLQSIEKKNFCFRSESDSSLWNAMNKAIQLVETEYCMFLNSGDYFWSPYVVEKINNAISHFKFEFAFGKYVLGGLPGFPQRTRGAPIKNIYSMFYGNVPCHQVSVISMKAFQKNGLYSERLGIYGDRDWVLRYGKMVHPKSFHFLPFEIAYYDPSGLSYQKSLSHRGYFFRMCWKNGSFLCFGFAILGFIKNSIYVVLSRVLCRLKNKR